MPWQRVIAQRDEETVYAGADNAESVERGLIKGDTVDQATAERWLATKKASHLEKGYTITEETPTSFRAFKQREEFSKDRVLFIREV